MTPETEMPPFSEALESAERAAASQDPAREVELYSDLVRQYPEEHVPFFRRALAKRSLGQCEEAIRDIDEAIRRESKEPSFYYFRGMWQLDSGAYDLAIEDLSRAAHLDAALSSTYYQTAARFLQAVALVLANRREEAARVIPELPNDYQCFAAGRLWTTKQLRVEP